MIGLIAAVIMLGFFAGTYAVAFVLGVWVGKRGGVWVTLAQGFTQARRIDEVRRRASGGKHRGRNVSVAQILGR